MITDAGGLRVPGGGIIRRGQLLRVAGDLVTEAELDAAGVGTIIDMRGRAEDRSLIETWARRAGVEYVWIPIDVAGSEEAARRVHRAPDAAAARAGQREIYRLVVDHHVADLGRAVELVATRGPIAYGCAAGKDRTGILTALWQTALGVPEDDVVRHYATAAPPVDRLRRLMLDRGLFTPENAWSAGAEAMLSAPDWLLRDTLAHLREEHGGVDAYLRAGGVSAGALDALAGRVVARAA